MDNGWDADLVDMQLWRTYILKDAFFVCYYVYSTHAWVISLEDKKDESKPK